MTSKIVIGNLPEICGYGISVAGFSKKEVKASMKKAYKEFKESYGFDFDSDINTFEKAMEHFGGSIEVVETNKAYYEGFKE